MGGSEVDFTKPAWWAALVAVASAGAVYCLVR